MVDPICFRQALNPSPIRSFALKMCDGIARRDKNDVDKDSSALDGGDFEDILEHVKNLLEHIKYQDEIIAAQSRELLVRPYPSVHDGAKRCRRREVKI